MGPSYVHQLLWGLTPVHKIVPIYIVSYMLVEKPNEFVMEYHMNDGMSEQDAMSFIQRLTGIKGDTKARELVNKLHRLPLGISV